MKIATNSPEYALQGFLYGLLATVVMTLIMFIGMKSGISPMPEPIPVAIAKLLLGPISKPALIIVGLLLHLGYGGVNGSIVAAIFKRKSSFWHGIAWAILLWLIMQLVVLPILGWGLFGTAVSLKIAMATLILHIVYGTVLGWGLSRISNKVD